MASNVVFGAGLAGLNAALELAESNTEPVIVIERQPHVGGLSTSIDWNGTHLDIGPHRIFTQFPQIEKQINDLLGPELIQVQRSSHMYLGGHFIDYPPKLLQMTLALGPRKLLKWGMGFLKQKIRSKRPSTKEETYERYVIGQFGNGLYRDFFLPYTRKVWGAEPSTLSADIVRTRVASKSVLSTLFNRDKGKPTTVKEFPYPRRGIGRLAESLAEQVRERGGTIHLECEPKSMDIIDGRIAKVYCRHTGTGEDIEIETSNVVSTIPLGTLLNLLEEPENPGDTLEYVDLRLVYLMLDVPEVRPDTWLYFPEKEIPFSRIYEAGNFSPECVPEGKSVLCVEVPQTPVEKFSDEELSAAVISSLTTTGMITPDLVIDELIRSVPKAYPLYRVGYKETIRSILSLLSKYENLVTTGRQGLFAYNNLDHSLLIGTMAAEKLLQGPEFVREFYRDRDSLCEYQIVD